MRTLLTTLGVASLSLIGAAAIAGPTLADVGITAAPAIVAGDPNGMPPDSPSNRIDPNLWSSPFAGVVSINIRYRTDVNDANSRLSFICSGAALNAYYILTAAHCIDKTGTGQYVNLADPGSDVRVVLNQQNVANGPNSFTLFNAADLWAHPDYDGFGICPFVSSDQCLNDDIAVLRLANPLPAAIPTYQIASSVAPGAQFTMVGFGTSGDGIQGYNVSPSFFTKRKGANIYDLYDTNDEALFDPNSAPEVWYYDFDGDKGDANGHRDTWCVFFGVCGTSLGNDIETHVGGGDSGGPSFVQDGNGNWLLAANNTFGGNVCYPGDPRTAQGRCAISGDFGDIGGGILLQSYRDWIRNIVPAPGTIALVGLALMGLGLRRRARQL